MERWFIRDGVYDLMEFDFSGFVFHVERGNAINCCCDEDVYVVALTSIEGDTREELLEGVFHSLESPLLPRTPNSAEGLCAKMVDVCRESGFE